ncbi:MAG: PAS domain-containing sensor histidine kinase, partial [Actinomycetota bacterium]|nr:PAS domain-containing sensor histidine kinase [Actinomycetota bacterium]
PVVRGQPKLDGTREQRESESTRSHERGSDEPLRLLRAELEQRVGERTSELEKERARLVAVLQQMPAAVLIADAASGTVATNAAADEMLARARAARAKPARAADGGVAADCLSESEALARALRRGEATSAEEVELELDDGTVMPIELSVAPVRAADGEIIAAVLTFRDLSLRKRRERAERDFVSNAAHELRTPLTAITSAIEVLQSGAKELPAERDLFLSHIERETSRLARLARSLLVLARAQSGEEKPALELVELRPLLESIAAGLGVARAVRVAVECQDDLGAVAHRDLLEQAILGVAANAARHTTSGDIGLRARHYADRRVEIEISDTGRGMSAVEQEHAFGRFYRAADGIGEGFGLGLAITRQAVEALDGTIDLVSEPGRGTTVRIVLPAAVLVRP